MHAYNAFQLAVPAAAAQMAWPEDGYHVVDWFVLVLVVDVMRDL